MLRFLIVCVLFYANHSFALVKITAKILLPPREASQPDMAKLSLAWSPLCTSAARNLPISFSQIQGVVSPKNLGCQSEPPDSVEEWDTLAAQILIFNQLYTFEFRESAQLYIGADEEGTFRFDMNPIEVDEPVDRVVFKDVQVTFSPGEKVVCSPKLFGAPNQALRARVRKSTCLIDRLIF